MKTLPLAEAEGFLIDEDVFMAMSRECTRTYENVLDTNVILAGLGTRGISERLPVLCLRDHEVFISPFILRELRRRHVGKFAASAELADEATREIAAHCRRVVPARMHAGA